MSKFKGRPPGVVVYDGSSEIDGRPILMIATLRSENYKTGDMIQTWMLRKYVNPISAINSGADSSICGSCPLKGRLEVNDSSGRKTKTVNRGRGCYVRVEQAPLGIWKSFKRGNYPVYSQASHARWFESRGVRLGSYGDPVAVPLEVVAPILKIAPEMSQVGYTHQWLTCNQDWRFHLMASTHSSQETELANEMGWRSFRTRHPESEVRKDEVVCPASEESGYRTDCLSCGMCNGSAAGGGRGLAELKRGNIAIVAHGGVSKASSVLEHSG